jgi:hypothetical protein
MRRGILGIAALLLMTGLAWAGDDCGCAAANNCCAGHGCSCGLFGHGCCLFGHCHGGIDGLDRHFNCGCRGSYNYPVPPQYTYHWPGMYKQSRMTDYVSPWRFPPLRPYVDEVPVKAADELTRPKLLPVSHASGAESSLPAGEIESLSSRLLRSAR